MLVGCAGSRDPGFDVSAFEGVFAAPDGTTIELVGETDARVVAVGTSAQPALAVGDVYMSRMLATGVTGGYRGNVIGMGGALVPDADVMVTETALVIRRDAPDVIAAQTEWARTEGGSTDPCTDEYAGPEENLELDLFCKDAWRYRCVEADDGKVTASCSLYQQGQAEDPTIPDCPYCD